MPQLERTRPTALTPIPDPEVLCGWGGGEGAPMLVLRPADVDGVLAAVELAGAVSRRTPPGWIGAVPRGMGRSYGDAAQLRRGFALDTRRLTSFELDAGTGVLTTHAGVTIGRLLGSLVPRGWMVPVLPGTQHVSVGGAIASDIHGKNHGVSGTFGRHVLALGLVSAAGELLEVEPQDELFQATLGGMGMTGVIVWAKIALRAVKTSLLSVDTDRVGDLDGALAALSAPGGCYRVAWLDLLGRRPGRGIVTRAEHLDDDTAASGAKATVRARARVPAWWPEGVLRPAAVAAFNELRFRGAPRHERGEVQSIGEHMFPLDGLDAWPRLYGRSGFVQYQLVVPYGAERVLDGVIARLRAGRVPCYLAVLKDFGPANSAPLSFPIAGWTLALDLPRRAEGLGGALEDCDRLVAEAGGRIYLTKDARLAPETLRAMYPRLEEWQAVREAADSDRLWRSDLALRTGLLAA